MIGDNLVGVTSSHLPQHFDFTLGQPIVRMVLRYLDGDFGGNSSFTTMHAPNRFGQFLPKHVLKQVGGSSSFEGSLCLDVSTIGGQDNDAGARKFLANSQNCLGPIHERHL